MEPKQPIISDDHAHASGKNEMQSVTVLVTRRVKAGREQEFEALLKRLRDAAASYPGHQGVTTIRPRPPSREYLIVYRFDNADHLHAWQKSPERQSLISESTDLAEAPPEEQKLSGMDTWFTLPGGRVVRPPAQWKMWLLSMAGIYPIITILVLVTQPFLAPFPLPVRFAVLTAVLTALMTWIVMPALSRVFARWLYR
jgi:antibiotic biosynthesis monooxygenase (ABM) superfamily enzyme